MASTTDNLPNDQNSTSAAEKNSKSVKELNPTAQEFHPVEKSTSANSESADEQEQSEHRRRDNQRRANHSPNNRNQAWKRGGSAPRGKKKEEGEFTADPNVWPSLEQMKLSPEVAKKTEGSNTITATTTTTTTTTEAATAPSSTTTAASSANSAANKKKPNWVPIPVELQSRNAANASGANSNRRDQQQPSNSNPNGQRRGSRGNRYPPSNGAANPAANATTAPAPSTTTQTTTTNTNTNTNTGNNSNRQNWRKPNSNPRQGGMGGRRPYYPQVYFAPVDPEQLKPAILFQVEYYFSVENLCKDVWFRNNMDAEGYVPASLIANFNRVKILTTDPALILESAQQSTVLECKDDKIRRKSDWKTWLPVQQSSQSQEQTNA